MRDLSDRSVTHQTGFSQTIFCCIHATRTDPLSDATDYPFGEEYNCKERYFELFPDVSERTRMRDYEILNGIGYTIQWDEYEKRHIVQGYLHLFMLI